MRSSLLVLAALVSVAVEAQPTLTIGDRVRVHTGDRVLVGTFVSFEDDAVLVSQGGPADAFAYDDVRLLETRVRRSRWRGAGRGALIGAGVGAAAGLGFYYLVATSGPTDGFTLSIAGGISTFIIFPGTALVGAAAGALIPGKNWALVPGSAALRPAFVGSALGSGSGASLRIQF